MSVGIAQFAHLVLPPGIVVSTSPSFRQEVRDEVF